ncbi:hypothetical protein KW849_14240 [Pseudomonas sp. PDM26]|uniref:hypothetical protein n=1 Tax=Pseudomonas TaxID=286 RepID=UPI001C44B786|nr:MULTISPECIES: hypothetical protein [Pseudomonas]MBV7547447.1 hypothetical protein [Pseudomonas sp. PDM26]MCT9826012.1 hypothetical protein [Pseudomonas veronii]
MKYIKPIICCSAFYILIQLFAIKSGLDGVTYMAAGFLEYLVAALVIMSGLYLAHTLAGTKILTVLKLLLMVVLAYAIYLGVYAMAGHLDLLISLNLLAVTSAIVVLLGTGIYLIVVAALLAKENAPARIE